ncbi:OstA family protein [Chondrocystis sp. NIES-4102]|nr:OstA family protein [Chondrocystis sp. NIES-4102]
MGNFWRCCIGIILWICLPQLSLLASEITPINRKAKDLLSDRARSGEVINPSHSLRQELILSERRGKISKFAIPIANSQLSAIPIEQVEVIEVIADRQEYDLPSQVIRANGKVVMRFAQSVMQCDRLEINLEERIAVAYGNVVLKRGEQVLRGEKFEYNLIADRGIVYNAGGEIYQPSLAQDIDLRQKLTPPSILDQSLSDRLVIQQPLSNVTGSTGIETTFGNTRDNNLLPADSTTTGTINRLRFQAAKIDFAGSSWSARDLRLTNDPFSPPELELRAETAEFQPIDLLTNRLTTTKSRVVIDDRFTIPLLTSVFVFDDRFSQPGIFNLGFDGEERGGLYIESTFKIIETENFSWRITPQYFWQRALFPTTFGFSNEDQGGVFNSAAFGLKNRLQANLSPRTNFTGNISLTSFNFNQLDDNLRAKVAIQQTVGQLANPYTFSLEYNYRDRLFNGSLGFQTVTSSVGGVITSPNIAIADTGVTLRYQGSIQNISADTDRQDLLSLNRDNDRINLTRYQAALFLDKTFPIWSGKPLPSTREQGLRYTPNPVVPYWELFTGISGVSSIYSNNDTQLSLAGNIGIRGQLGHFSRSWLDYTGFELSYAQNIRGDASPFLFDRIVDRQTLTLGITQQVYGPIRLGFQTAVDLNDNNEISTDYLLEYSRRTHNVTLRYNPILELGSFSLRISDFNWQGNPQPFESEGVTPVIQGVKQELGSR